MRAYKVKSVPALPKAINIYNGLTDKTYQNVKAVAEKILYIGYEPNGWACYNMDTLKLMYPKLTNEALLEKFSGIYASDKALRSIHSKIGILCEELLMQCKEHKDLRAKEDFLKTEANYLTDGMKAAFKDVMRDIDLSDVTLDELFNYQLEIGEVKASESINMRSRASVWTTKVAAVLTLAGKKYNKEVLLDIAAHGI